MEANESRDKQFAVALACLVVLTGAGVGLGLLLTSSEEGVRLEIVMPAALALLVVFGLVAYVVAHRPLQALEVRDQEIRKLTASDPLTGLLNREHTLELLEREMNRAWRGGEQLACALVDIDRLEQINKQFGQTAGNGLLRSVGNVVAETCRQYDAAGRYGDAQFLLILPGIELDDAGRAAERLRQRIETSQFACDEQGFSITVSVGVTQADPETAEDADALIARADEALKRAKSEGRNRVCATAAPSAVT